MVKCVLRRRPNVCYKFETMLMHAANAKTDNDAKLNSIFGCWTHRCLREFPWMNVSVEFRWKWCADQNNSRSMRAMFSNQIWRSVTFIKWQRVAPTRISNRRERWSASARRKMLINANKKYECSASVAGVCVWRGLSKYLLIWYGSNRCNRNDNATTSPTYTTIPLHSERIPKGKKFVVDGMLCVPILFAAVFLLISVGRFAISEMYLCGGRRQQTIIMMTS